MVENAYWTTPSPLLQWTFRELGKGQPLHLQSSNGPRWKQLRRSIGWRTIVLLVIVILCISHPLVSGQTGRQSVDEITAALRSKEYGKAIQSLQAPLKNSPHDPRLWTLQGMAFEGQQRMQDALASFCQALSFSPDYLPALQGAAQIQYAKGSQEAVEYLRRILKQRPQDQTTHGMLAVLAYRRSDCTIAISQFEQSRPLLKSQPATGAQYCECLMRLKRYEKAVDAARELLSLQSNDSRARQRLAAIQLMAGHPKEALTTIQGLLASQPSVAVLSLAANAYEDDGDTPQAVKLLQQAIIQEPQDVDLYVQFANLSFVHQSFQVGVDMINAGLAVQPKAAALYLARGVLYVQLADFDRAEADFEEANDLDPHLELTGTAQGMIAQEKNDLDKALFVVRAKVARHPNDAMLLNMQADILVQKSPSAGSPDFQRAIASARKAISLQPSLVYGHDTLAKLYLQAGQNQQAVDECRRALHYDRNDQVALYHLILGLRRTGHKADLPMLVKRLAELREASTKKEAERNRYKLVEATEPAELETTQ
jgi:tetratricopeptide (TPR) repeat protein